MITDYKIVQAPTLEYLEEFVQALVAMGWEPFEEIICDEDDEEETETTPDDESTESDTDNYIQAMIKCQPDAPWPGEMIMQQTMMKAMQATMQSMSDAVNGLADHMKASDAKTLSFMSNSSKKKT